LLIEPTNRADAEDFDDHDYTPDLKKSWLYRYLHDAREAEAPIRPKDAVAAGADKGISRRSVFRLFEKLANARMAEPIDGTDFPRVTYWELIAETAGPHTKSGGTTGTTGTDQGKRGDTTAIVVGSHWHYGRNRL
jgi:hypothetical protein